MYKPKVYTASKIHYHLLWQKMKEDMDWDFVQWTASWVDHPDIPNEMEGEEILDSIFREAWIANIKDVKDSDFVLVYSRSGESLKGALVECGCALGLGITVLAVGLPEEHSWTHHPGVVRFPSLKEARQYLYRFTTMIPAAKRRRADQDDQK
jgi:hypothetical protein